MESKILQFRPLPESSRRPSERRGHRPTQSELITQQARNRYLDKVDRIRHASIDALSPVPYNAWA